MKEDQPHAKPLGESITPLGYSLSDPLMVHAHLCSVGPCLGQLLLLLWLCRSEHWCVAFMSSVAILECVVGGVDLTVYMFVSNPF